MLGDGITQGNVIAWCLIIGGWVVVIGGWVVVHRLSLGRERRKENREAVDLVVEAINEIESEAIAFHCAEKFDGNVIQNLTGKIQRLIKRIKREPLNALNVSDDRFIGFRQSITLRNVEPSEFQQQDHTSEIVRMIRDESDSLIDAIEEGKSKYFK